MPTMREIDDVRFHGPEKTVVPVSGGVGNVAVVFDQAYEITPNILIVTPRGAAGTYAVDSSPAATKTGFSIDVTGETDAAFNGQDVTVIWFACERN